MRIEEILSERGNLRWDGKPFSSASLAFNNVSEFILLFYGSSRDKKSRQVAQCLNVYADQFNPDEPLRKERDEIVPGSRKCQIFYVPCELSFNEFQSFYSENYEYGWIYPDFPQDPDENLEVEQIIFGNKK